MRVVCAAETHFYRLQNGEAPQQTKQNGKTREGAEHYALLGRATNVSH